jgi:hypothetical protein
LNVCCSKESIVKNKGEVLSNSRIHGRWQIRRKQSVEKINNHGGSNDIIEYIRDGDYHGSPLVVFRRLTRQDE